MTDVRVPPGRYRTALAELPLSTRRVEWPGGSIVVVPGDVGWVDAALGIAAAGARAVVVARPSFAPAAEIRRLHDGAGVPVIVERTLLRPDSAGDAAAGRSAEEGWSAPRLLVADGSAPRDLVPVVARDAVGWLRLLVGDDLGLVASDDGLALFQTTGAIAASLSIVETARTGSGSFRVRALGEVLTEIVVDGDRTRVRTSTVRGSLVPPARFESSARLAVRRALAAVDSGEPADDLRELAADAELVEGMLVDSA